MPDLPRSQSTLRLNHLFTQYDELWKNVDPTPILYRPRAHAAP